MPFYWPSFSLPFGLLLISLSLLSFSGFLLWGWGLRADRVLTKSQSCLALPTFFNNNNNNNNNNNIKYALKYQYGYELSFTDKVLNLDAILK